MFTIYDCIMMQHSNFFNYTLRIVICMIIIYKTELHLKSRGYWQHFFHFSSVTIGYSSIITSVLSVIIPEFQLPLLLPA